MSSLEELRQQAAADPEIPEGVRNFLIAGATLDEIRLDAYGRWFHQGEPFVNVKLANLFHQSLHRTQAGTWLLRIPPYTYPVSVELTNLFIKSFKDDTSAPKASIVGRPDHTPIVDLTQIYSDGEELLACRIDGKPARIVDVAYRDLLEKLDEDNGKYVVRFRNKVVPILPLPDDFFNDSGEN